MTAYEEALSRFDHLTKTVDGVERDVWVAGEGPGVLVIHEVPGLHPEVIRFGQDLVDRGFTVWMPSLFGTPGKKFNPFYVGQSIVSACISKEFTTWRTGQNSPITDWLRGLARQLSDETGGKVGAVGMCLTGGFALALMVDDCVGAPVLSQPSLPFAVFPWQWRDVGVDAPTMDRIKERCAQGACVLGLRYSMDLAVPSQRFATLERELGDGFESVVVPSRGAFWKHSVLALDRHEPSVDRVIEFFKENTG